MNEGLPTASVAIGDQYFNFYSIISSAKIKSVAVSVLALQSLLVLLKKKKKEAATQVINAILPY